MTSSTSTKAIPTPAILVFGTPTGHDAPQASWFRSEDRTAVVAAARSLKFSVLEIQTDAERAIAKDVHEGVLKGNGRMIVSSVEADVYRRIEEIAAKATAVLVVKASDTVAVSNAQSEQSKNTGAAEAPDPWDGLRIGSYAICKYWFETGAANGWWLAVITDIDGDDFVIRWPDEPQTPPLKIQRKHIAIFHPSYDVKREWDRKR